MKGIMKDTKKKGTPAKWGTIDWVKENRYSKVDRKRRARMRKAIGEEAWEKTLCGGVHTCCLTRKLDRIIDEFGLELGKKNLQTLEKALLTVSEFERDIYDEAIGVLLARAWGLKK